MADMSGLGGFGKHHSSSTFGGVDELLAAIDAKSRSLIKLQQAPSNLLSA